MTHTTEPTPGADRSSQTDGAKGGHRKASRTKGGEGLHRRKFLGGMVGAGLAAVGAAGTTFSLLTSGGDKASAASTTLTIPDLLEGTASDSTTTFTLEAARPSGTTRTPWAPRPSRRCTAWPA